MIQHLSFTFFAFATQLFSTLVTSLNLHNQAPPYTGNPLLNRNFKCVRQKCLCCRCRPL